MAGTVKVRRPSGVAPKKAAALDEGDSVEFSMTAYVKRAGKGEFWIKCGAQTTVRPGEAPDDAVGRLHAYVIENLEQQIEETTR